MISEKRSPNKLKMKLKVTVSIWNLKSNAETSSVGIKEIKHIKPK